MSGQRCSRTSWQSMHVIDWEMRKREMCVVTQEFRARKPPSAWLYSSAASAWGWGKSCSFPPWWHRSLPLSHRRTCSDQPHAVNMDNPLVGSGEDVIWEQMYNVLQAPVEVRRRAWNNGFDEERLLAMALLVAPHDAEAPAVVVGLLQDDVPAPVEVTRREGGVGLLLT